MVFSVQNRLEGVGGAVPAGGLSKRMRLPAENATAVAQGLLNKEFTVTSEGDI